MGEERQNAPLLLGEVKRLVARLRDNNSGQLLSSFSAMRGAFVLSAFALWKLKFPRPKSTSFVSAKSIVLAFATKPLKSESNTPIRTDEYETISITYSLR